MDMQQNGSSEQLPQFKVGDRVVIKTRGRLGFNEGEVGTVKTVCYGINLDRYSNRDNVTVYKEEYLEPAPKLCWHCGKAPRLAGQILCGPCLDSSIEELEAEKAASHVHDFRCRHL